MSTDIKIHNIFMLARASVTKMVSRIVPPKEVEDIVQETYVRLCQLKSPTSIEKPKSFLYQTAKNLALDHLKRAETRLADAFDDEEAKLDSEDVDSTFQAAASQKEFTVFCEAVRTLPIQCQKAFVLKKVYGYSQKEIAQTMGLSESTVEKHIAHGIKKCTQYMRRTQAGANQADANEASTNQANTNNEHALNAGTVLKPTTMSDKWISDPVKGRTERSTDHG